MRWIVLMVTTVSTVARLAGAEVQGSRPDDANYEESKIAPYELPDPLVCFDGRRVTDVKMWCEVRRPEILAAFTTNMYGRIPELPTRIRFETREAGRQALDGLATRRQVTIRLFEEEGAPRIDLLLYIPNHVSKPVPVFLGLSYGNQGVHDDPAIFPSRDTVSKRGAAACRWPLELILKRGYAVATFAGADVEQDKHGSGTAMKPDAWRLGVRGYALKRSGCADTAGDEWGTIAAWAWGLSRAMDYLETDKDLSPEKVVVIGHSRTGKAALWAAAQDRRFAIAVSNDSGEGGAALSRRRFGETIRTLPKIWFAKNYQKFADNEDALPFDQHLLIALIAPRPVYVASATEDLWADPRGEFLAALNAGPVYRLFALNGLGVAEMPPPDQTTVGETVGYHLRTGKHDLTPFDWNRYLSFCDRHFGRVPLK